jgi:integrase/recombinase XerD
MAAAGEPLVPHREFAMADGGRMPVGGGGPESVAEPLEAAGNRVTSVAGPAQESVDPRDTPLAAVVPSSRRGEPVPLWVETIPGFCRSLFLALSEGTCRTYLEALSRYIREVGDPLEVSPAEVEAFLARSATRLGLGGEPRPRAASTRVVELAALRRYHRWAVREGLRPDDPTTSIELRAAEPYRDLTALSADQVRSLLAAIPDNDEGARLRCLLLWYLLSGRRRVEILRLRWGDLDLEAGTYTYTRKGGKSEKRSLLPVLRDLTLAYARRCKVPTGPERPVFPGRFGNDALSPRHVTRLITRAAAQAELPTRRPVHALRHSYARLLREVGASVEDVQHSLDHASLATTTTYLRKLEGAGDPFGPQLAELLLGAPVAVTITRAAAVDPEGSAEVGVDPASHEGSEGDPG